MQVGASQSAGKAHGWRGKCLETEYRLKFLDMCSLRTDTWKARKRLRTTNSTFATIPKLYLINNLK